MQESGGAPWWKFSSLFTKERTLFGAWDGVFTTVMVNIFTVVAFLRTGWIVVGSTFAHHTRPHSPVRRRRLA